MDRTALVREQRERAAPVIADLLQQRRTFDALSEEKHGVLAGLPMVDLLLAEAQALRHDKPAKMIEATDLARRAAMRLDLKRDPELGATTLQNTILYAVDAGYLKRAQHLLWNAQAHNLLPDGEVARIKLRATAGEIFAGLGQLDRAEAAFRTAREEFEDLGLDYVAAITGLDLAAVWLRQGRMEEVKDLAEKLAAKFLGLSIQREALAAVLALREACRQGRVTVESLRKIATYLRDLERPGAPPPLAELG